MGARHGHEARCRGGLTSFEAVQLRLMRCGRAAEPDLA
jgi:hypothetical protein